MEELHKIIKKKYKDFDITSQHLGPVIRDNNITRKRTWHKQKMINNFKKIFGKTEDVIICAGDFEQKQGMKNMEKNQLKIKV